MRTCDKCPYKYKTQHIYKSGMVGEITMCGLYDKELYYYGDSIPKPNYKHNCFKEFMENKMIDFRIGDYVETTDGLVGVIDDICTCSECEARGFYEPHIKYINGEEDYITVYQAENIEKNFNRIGKYVFRKEEKENEELKEHDCQTVSCCTQLEFKETVSKLLNEGYEISSSSCNSSRDWKAILVK